jgi:hypothetical protein
MPGAVSLSSDVGVFQPHQLGGLDVFFRAHGFAILRGLFTGEIDAILAECEDAQRRVADGELAERYGNSILIDIAAADGAAAGARRFANYVQYITELAPRTRDAVSHSVIAGLMKQWVPNGHLREHSRFGVVYQDARGASGYRRIGWHSDWQSGPQLDVWPSAAFTLHIDGTSPANGFLRVVPGSHRWATPAPFRNANNVPLPTGAKPAGGYSKQAPPFDMPLGFDKVAGEFAVYCEAGDVLFHDAYLWHSAAAATDEAGIRRHIRGAWFSGPPDAEARDYLEDFVKNAAR